MIVGGGSVGVELASEIVAKYKNKKVIDKIQDLYNIEKMKDKIKK